VRATDYRWRELFEAADVVSEGAPRTEVDGQTYYGTSSILLRDAGHGGLFPASERAALLALLELDPHARLRAVRVACLEAQLRSKAPLSELRTEITLRVDARGVRVDVDISAQLRLVPERSARPRR